MSIETVVGSAGIFMFDRRAETMPRNTLSALQTSRLKQTLDHAYTTIERNLTLPACGRAISNHSPILPIFRSPRRLICATIIPSTCSRSRAKVCCGCTHRLGRPVSRPLSDTPRGTSDLWSDLMARSFACAGVRPGDIVHNAYGYGLFTGGLGAHYGAERLGCTVVPVSGGGTERQVTLLADFGANVLCATPSYALNIAEVALGMGVDLRRAKLRVGVFGAEPWSDAVRRELEERLGIKRARRLRTIRDFGSRRCMRMPIRAGRVAWMGGPFSVRGR